MRAFLRLHTRGVSGVGKEVGLWGAQIRPGGVR